jgi:hypothetical protein
MKKIAIILMAVLLFVSAAFASGSVTATANVTARIQSAWSIVRLTNMDFGTIVYGTTSVPAIASNTTSAASFQVTSTGPASATATATTTDLTDGSGHSISFALGNIFYGPSTGTASGATDGLGNTAVPITTGGNSKLNLYIGGTITPTSTQAVGSYSGTVTVQIDYN